MENNFYAQNEYCEEKKSVAETACMQREHSTLEKIHLLYCKFEVERIDIRCLPTKQEFYNHEKREDRKRIDNQEKFIKVIIAGGIVLFLGFAIAISASNNKRWKKISGGFDS